MTGDTGRTAKAVCPVGVCAAPLPATGVCPRDPAHTPAAWEALSPQRQGIFPGHPRVTGRDHAMDMYAALLWAETAPIDDLLAEVDRLTPVALGQAEGDVLDALIGLLIVSDEIDQRRRRRLVQIVPPLS